MRGIFIGDDMKIRKMKTTKEIEPCIDLYIQLNDEEFIPSNKKSSMRSLLKHLQEGAFFRLLEDDDGKIVAWILATKCMPEHTGEVTLQQRYYGSNLTGIKSARAVKVLHEALIYEAQRQGISRVISMGSHLDPENIFTRILEKMGWKRRHYIATYEL
jgi:hypothetical protein